MIGLLDTVALKRDRPDLGVSAGQLGAVVDVHGAEAFEIEFVDPEGRTIVMATIAADDLVLHERLKTSAPRSTA